MTEGFWLSEAQFGRLVLYLPNETRGVPRVDDRRVISGIIHVLQSGCRWKDAPGRMVRTRRSTIALSAGQRKVSGRSSFITSLPPADLRLR